MGTHNDSGSFAVSWQRLVALFIPLALLVTALPARTPATASDLPIAAGAQPAAFAPQAVEPTPKPAALPPAAAVSPPASYDALHNCASSSAGWSRFAGHGVNVVCGNFVAQNVDFSIAGRGLPFTFARTYNSSNLIDGPLGFGWTHSYSMALVVETGGSVLIRSADGRRDRFMPNGASYTPPPGVFSTLVANADGTFTLIQRDQARYQFDATGRLTSIMDRNGNTLTLGYTNNQLATVTDAVGRVVTFSYNANGRLARVTDALQPTPRSVAFAYDAAGNLVSTTDARGKITAFTYDSAHRLLSIRDANGNTALLNTYDANGRVSAQQDAGGYKVAFAYDYANGRTKFTNEAKRATTFSFDAQYRVTGEQDALNGVAVASYDARNNLTGFTDKRGFASAFAYDGAGNLISATDPYGKTTSATYDPLNNPLTITDARGNVTRMVYDTKGNLTSLTDPLNRVTTFAYDANGQLTLMTDSEGRTTAPQYDAQGNIQGITDAYAKVTTFSYDTVGRLTGFADARPTPGSYSLSYDGADNPTQVVDAKGGTTRFTYDNVGNRLTATDANTQTTTFIYDKRNLLTSVTDAAGKITRYTYTPVGNQATVTDARNATNTYTYDARERLVKVQDPSGGMTAYVYDANNNRTKVTDALGQATSYKYDALNRLTQVTSPLVQTTRYTYDEVGNRTAVTDANGATTRYVYDAANQLVQVIDSNGKVLRYDYDKVGNRIKVTDAIGHAMTYTYDKLNRLIAIADGLGNTTRYTYDEVGNRTKVTDANNSETNYVYDQLNRVSQILYPDQTIAFDYDKVGNRTTMTDNSGVTRYAYDPLNRLTSLTRSDTSGASLTLNYAYDEVGNRIGLTYPGGKQVSYAYDALNRLMAVNDSGAKTSYSYDKLGNRTTIAYPNGVVTRYGYDKSNRLTSIRATSPVSGTLLRVDYVLDAVGNRRQMVDDEGLTSYSYDKLYRLTGVTYPNGVTVGYTYYDNGNRKTMTGPEGTTSYTYDAADQLTSMTLAGKTTQFGYDKNGNMTAKGANTYTYDKANRLTKAVLPKPDGTTTTVEYTYDGDGYRTSRTVNGIVTKYTWDTQAALPEMLVSTLGTEQTQYVYGGDLLAQTNPMSNTSYYHADGLGSIRAISNANAQTASRYTYDAFGRTRSQEGLLRNPYQFTGQQVDDESGLVYLRARYYDPEIGRFLSRDTVLTEHPYAYVGNNPTRLVDPKGKWGISIQINASYAGKIIGGTEGSIGIGPEMEFPTWNPLDWRFGVSAGAGAKVSTGPEVQATFGIGVNAYFWNTANIVPGASDAKGATICGGGAISGNLGVGASANGGACTGDNKSGFEVGGSLNTGLGGGASGYASFNGGTSSTTSIREFWSSLGVIYNWAVGNNKQAANIQQVQQAQVLGWYGEKTAMGKLKEANSSSGRSTDTRTNGLVNERHSDTAPGPVVVKGNSPRKPTATSPSDWYLERSGGQVQVCARDNGSPDAGVSIAAYEFKAGGAGWPGYWDSKRVTSNCATTSGLKSGSYPWQARVQDNRGLWSDWSDVRYFTIGSTALTLDDLRFSGGSGDDLVRVYTSVRSDVLGNNLKMWANTATDGSADGDWQWIDPQGRIEMDPNDVNTWSRWDTDDLADGTHRVRAIAYRGTIAGGDYVEAVKEATFTLTRRRPSRTLALSPAATPINVQIGTPGAGQWFNTRTITFTWQPVLDQRITSFQFAVSANTDPNNNPLVTRTFDPSVRSFSYTFDADYPQMAWEIKACNEIGCGQGGGGALGIDRAAPSATVTALPATTYELNFPVQWSGNDNASGITAYDVQYKDGANGTWLFWKVNQTVTNGVFNGQNGHTYFFRARARDKAGNESLLTGNGDTSIRVDTSTRPVEPWWNAAYSAKRNLLIVNQDAARALPAGYPVLLRFTSATIPSAADIYNSSQSAVKGDDVRLALNNQTELARFIPKFAPDQVDIWFKLQAPIAASGTDKASYQLYSGNSAATNPPANVADVMPPPVDANTIALWHMQEATGGTATDSVSGRVATSYSNGGGNFGWEYDAFLGAAALFSGQPQDGKGVWMEADGNGLTPAQITVEAWVREDSQGVERTLVSRQSNDGSGWQLYLQDGRPSFEVNNARTDAAGIQSLTPGTWYYIAGTYDGSTLRVYLNGQKISEKTVNVSMPTGAGALRIGKNGDTSNYFPGAIQHVRISNVARTSFPEASYTAIAPKPQLSAGDVVPRPKITPTPTNTPTATPTNTPSPTPVPAAPWWNNAYAFRRTLIVGNAGAAPMPAGRPIMVILNNTTTPTAQEIYNASQSSTKGSDLRVVWRGQTMMPLYMFAFTPNDVQLYFPLQQDLGTGMTSGNDYTIYYGNPNPGPSISDVNAVFPPAMDNNTIGLWHFQESQGFIAYDTSGYGNNVSIQSTGASWGWENVGFLGSYIRFSNQPQDGGGTWLEGSGNGLNPAQLTVEAWILETAQGVERTMVARRAGSGMGWQLFLQDGKPAFEVNYDRLVSNVTLTVNQWYHVAGTYDGQSLKVYLNGSLIASKTTSATMPGASGVLRIGKHGDTSNYFNGAIQHVRISNIARTTFPAAIYKDSVTPPNIALGTQEAPTP